MSKRMTRRGRALRGYEVSYVNLYTGELKKTIVYACEPEEAKGLVIAVHSRRSLGEFKHVKEL